MLLPRSQLHFNCKLYTRVVPGIFLRGAGSFDEGAKNGFQGTTSAKNL